MYKFSHLSQSRNMEAQIQTSSDGQKEDFQNGSAMRSRAAVKASKAPLSLLVPTSANSLEEIMKIRNLVIASTLLTGLLATGFGQAQQERTADERR